MGAPQSPLVVQFNVTSLFWSWYNLPAVRDLICYVALYHRYLKTLAEFMNVRKTYLVSIPTSTTDKLYVTSSKSSELLWLQSLSLKIKCRKTGSPRCFLSVIRLLPPPVLFSAEFLSSQAHLTSKWYPVVIQNAGFQARLLAFLSSPPTN